MDTKIGPVGGLYKPREAESADTRYGLLHQEALRYGDGRRGRRDGGGFEGLEEDQATVSIDALLLFLESFLSRHFGVTPEESGVEHAPESRWQRSAASVEALRLKAAQASRAYEDAAHVSHKVARRNRESGQTADNHAERDELDMVVGLIRDLRVLAAQDVSSLKIERGKTFIDSLAVAVLQAKQKLSS